MMAEGGRRLVAWARRAANGRGRQRNGGLALVALAVALMAACGGGGSTSTIHRTPPVWTPSASPNGSSAATTDWPMFDFGPPHRGVNPSEMAISRTTVSHLHRLWSSALPDVADSTPIFLHNVTLSDGQPHDVLYLTTKSGTLVALDAASGHQLWKATTSGPRFTTSSPAVDPAAGYVYSYGLDGKVHKYHAATGDEVTTSPWPVTITKMMQTEKESSALTIGNGYLYVTTAGYPGDAPPYQGHVVAIDLASGAVHVFNSLCSNLTHVLAQGECPDDTSGIWARPGVTVDPVTGNVFATTGNGAYTGNQGGHDWGDSVLELSADASRLIDTYTPSNYAQLDQSDTDLGGMEPALLPTIPQSKTPYLAVQIGKDGILRLLDRQNLSGQGGPGHLGGELQTLAVPNNCTVLTQPAVWTDPSGTIWLLLVDSCGAAGFQVATSSGGVTELRQMWSTEQGGTSPVVGNGVLFAATSGKLFALNPLNGQQLWSSTDKGAGGTIGGIHWESPIVVGGRVYVPDESGHLTAYGL